MLNAAGADVIRIGTRGSPLALAQAHEARLWLMQAHGLEENQFEIVVISTTGDRILNHNPLPKLEERGFSLWKLKKLCRPKQSTSLSTR